uniref:WGS project CAEQ00000000 data, annotated contig 1532 n=1 Tax=Trypanosoma congolense (strain IL3000) TaxID=1068625 RepID=F9W6X2_TRYCI|nr:unnamed protein product [Trypanosoma congolense IL3000]
MSLAGDNSSYAVLFRGARVASWVVVCGYGAALAYRFGFLQRALPGKAAAVLESTVEKVKARTEPLGDPVRLEAVRRHLMKVYGISSVGMLAAALGGAVFFSYPKIPITIPIAFTVVPAALLFLMPRELMFPECRTACFLTSSVAVGCSFGPVEWVAWDSLYIFGVLTASTLSGLCVPLLLTRGMVSYVLSSQLLSSALSVVTLTSVPSLLSGNGTALLQSVGPESVNVLLMIQLMANMGINVLHTLPTITRFVKWRGTDDELLLSVDPLKEAFCICGGTAYVFWRCSRWVYRTLMYAALGKSPCDGGGQQECAPSLFDRWRSAMWSHRACDVGASVLLVLCYVRAVSALQRGDTADVLEKLRACFARASPVSLITAHS